MKLNTYLNYGGNCEQPDWKNAILHARMNIGETELMGADVPR